MKKRCGFVCVDLNNDGSGTLARSKKNSCDQVNKVIESHGLSPEKNIELSA